MVSPVPVAEAPPLSQSTLGFSIFSGVFRLADTPARVKQCLPGLRGVTTIQCQKGLNFFNDLYKGIAAATFFIVWLIKICALCASSFLRARVFLPSQMPSSYTDYSAQLDELDFVKLSSDETELLRPARSTLDFLHHSIRVSR